MLYVIWEPEGSKAEPVAWLLAGRLGVKHVKSMAQLQVKDLKSHPMVYVHHGHQPPKAPAKIEKHTKYTCYLALEQEQLLDDVLWEHTTQAPYASDEKNYAAFVGTSGYGNLFD